jgi:hypothetical protein
MSFVLRRCTEEVESSGRTVHTNQQVATFERVAAGVYVSHFACPNETIRDVIYQIYPGNVNETFYTLKRGEMLVVYCIINGNRACFCASHKERDHYIYFHALTDTTDIVVIKAQSVKEAEKLLQNKTEFTL